MSLLSLLLTVIYIVYYFHLLQSLVWILCQVNFREESQAAYILFSTVQPSFVRRGQQIRPHKAKMASAIM